nr:5'-nucleotidase C-terminal domain-containing protein [Thermoactinomyces sp. DSM 45892]
MKYPIKCTSIGFMAGVLITASLLTGFDKGANVEVSDQNLNLQILSINDFHGQIDKSGKANDKVTGTAEYLATHLKHREAQNKNTLLVHAGDVVGASSPASALLQDEPTIDILNKLNFDVGTVGNHEFDEGLTELKRIIDGGYHPKTGFFKGANFPYIVANVLDKKTKKPILPPHAIKVVEGVKIGFIGVVTQTTPSVVTPEGIKDVIFSDEAEAINQQVKELKKQGVKAIMVLAHEGGLQDSTTGKITGPIADITQKLDPEVDVVFAGHSHTYLNGTVDGKMIVQAGSYGNAFADVDVVVNKRTKDVVKKSSEIVYTYHEGITPDSRTHEIVEKAKAKVAPIISKEVAKSSGIITRAENTSGESALGNFIADSQRWKMSTDFAFMNPGGIRADMPSGKVTWGDLFTIQPFGNDLISMKLTGEQIRKVLNQQFQDPNRVRMLQISGLTYKWDSTRPTDNRVYNLKKSDGTEIDLAKHYTVTTNYFLATGGDDFTEFVNGTHRTIGPTDLDGLVEYVKQLPQPFHAKIEGRITKVN